MTNNTEWARDLHDKLYRSEQLVNECNTKFRNWLQSNLRDDPLIATEIRRLIETLAEEYPKEWQSVSTCASIAQNLSWFVFAIEDRIKDKKLKAGALCEPENLQQLKEIVCVLAIMDPLMPIDDLSMRMKTLTGTAVNVRSQVHCRGRGILEYSMVVESNFFYKLSNKLKDLTQAVSPHPMEILSI
ncbi:hypothetical protein EniLVp02_0047 [Vibrio phage EniLVp02]